MVMMVEEEEGEEKGEEKGCEKRRRMTLYRTSNSLLKIQKYDIVRGIAIRRKRLEKKKRKASGDVACFGNLVNQMIIIYQPAE